MLEGSTLAHPDTRTKPSHTRDQIHWRTNYRRTNERDYWSISPSLFNFMCSVSSTVSVRQDRSTDPRGERGGTEAPDRDQTRGKHEEGETVGLDDEHPWDGCV